MPAGVAKDYGEERWVEDGGVGSRIEVSSNEGSTVENADGRAGAGATVYAWRIYRRGRRHIHFISWWLEQGLSLLRGWHRRSKGRRTSRGSPGARKVAKHRNDQETAWRLPRADRSHQRQVCRWEAKHHECLCPKGTAGYWASIESERIIANQELIREYPWSNRNPNEFFIDHG